MKKVIAIIAASLTFAALATVDYSAGDYTPLIGVLTRNLTYKDNLIPVRYTSLADAEQAVLANNYVITNGIPENTYLYLFQDNEYKAFVFDPAVGWKVPASVSTTPSYVLPTGTEELALGSGIWLSFPSAPAVSNRVCVFGRVSSVTNSVVVGGKVNLLANPKSSSVTFTLKDAFSGAVNGDTIRRIRSENLPNDTAHFMYHGKSEKWYYSAGSELIETNNLTVYGYQGLWYTSKGGSGFTINW